MRMSQHRGGVHVARSDDDDRASESHTRVYAEG